MIKLNGYWYEPSEVKEALERKGYTVVTYEISDEPRDYPLYETYALQPGEVPSILNTIKSVALKEFNKKPPLV